LKETCLEFLRNQKITSSLLKETIYFQGKKLPKRFFYAELRRYLRDFLESGRGIRMVALAGLRGTGKTTLLWQLADYLLRNFKEKAEGFFVSLDVAYSYGFSEKDLIEGWHEIYEDLKSQGKTLVLFLDEVQYLHNWPLMLKVLYDKFKDCFIFVSGSSALYLHSTVDLATRWVLRSLLPLSFREFLMIKAFLGSGFEVPSFSRGEELRKTLFFSESLEELKKGLKRLEKEVQEFYEEALSWQELLREYILFHNLPRFIPVREEKVLADQTFDMLQRVVYQDLRNFYPENEVVSVFKLLSQLAASDEINPERLSQDLGVSKKRIERIIKSLIEAEVLLAFPPYGGTKTRVARHRKVFFLSPTLRYGILRQIFADLRPFFSRFLEDTVALYLRRLLTNGMYYLPTEPQKTPDFVVETALAPVVLEVGTAKKDVSQLRLKNMRYGILLNFDLKMPEFKDKIVIFPFKWFLLM